MLSYIVTTTVFHCGVFEYFPRCLKVRLRTNVFDAMTKLCTGVQKVTFEDGCGLRKRPLNFFRCWPTFVPNRGSVTHIFQSFLRHQEQPETILCVGSHQLRSQICVCGAMKEMKWGKLVWQKKKKKDELYQIHNNNGWFGSFYPQILKYWCVGLAALVGRQPKASVHLLHILCIKQGNMWLLTLVQSWLCEDCWRIEWTKVTFQSHAHTLHTKWVSSIDVWLIWCWFFKRNWSFKV